MHNPSKMNPKQMTGNDCENPSMIHEIKSGTLTHMNDFLRPILSQIGPLSKLPIGCATWAKLAMKEKRKLLVKMFNIPNRSIHRLIQTQEWLTAYTTMMYRLLLHESFHLDSSFYWCQLAKGSQLMEMQKIPPNWKYRSFSPLFQKSTAKMMASGIFK